MLTCRAATERLSRSFDAPLPTLDRLALGAHLMICSSCRQFRKQFREVHEMSKSAMALSNSSTDEIPMREEVKQRIVLEMEQQS